MNRGTRAGLRLLVLLGVSVGLLLLFPSAAKYAEAAARELRVLWWLILLVALAGWLWWSTLRRPK